MLMGCSSECHFFDLACVCCNYITEMLELTIFIQNRIRKFFNYFPHSLMNMSVSTKYEVKWK